MSLQFLAACAAFVSPVSAQEGIQQGDTYLPKIENESTEGADAMMRIKLPEGFVCELVAAEPHLANPVCFWPAVDGSFYVAETFRLHAGVTDMRQHTARLEEDMACDTVEDRVAMFKRWAGDKFKERYAQDHERIKLLRDTDGDGLVDTSVVYADGFKDAAVGIAAGLLEHNGSVYYTCIPDLWQLEDTDGDDIADVRTSLSYGYGVRVTLLGHDLHGLQIGPDGWLYFSCGDRGFNVKTPNGQIVHPDTGAVLRCRLDGSGLEVFHTGLRNPQELAFDEFGNLFTGDNNSDGGDQARWVQIVEGADSGWRSSYQWISEPIGRGPWNDELLWKPHFEGQATYVLPPITNIASGPSGLAYYPGTGVGDGLEGTFLLCDFRGGVSNSGVHAFELEAQGASFEVVNRREFLWNTLVTDVDFGPDGSIYFTDWVAGWGMTGKGRLYRTYDPTRRNTPEVRTVSELLTNGVADKGLDQLEVLMKHSDMRVRRLAQFELVAREKDGWDRLQRILKNPTSDLASLHAIWGLGMAAELEPGLLEFLHPFLRDANRHVRAQTARVLGDHRYSPAASHLIASIADDDPVVRKYAALACGRLAETRAVEALLELANKDAATDMVLRHAASWGLSNCATVEQLTAQRAHENIHVRLAAVVALRLKRSGAVGEFLADADPLVTLEAARAISDTPIEAGFPALAAILNREGLTDETLLRRALNGNLRLGGTQSVERLATFVANKAAPERLRADALDMLARWSTPNPRDYVLSNWEPLGDREAERAPEFIRSLSVSVRADPAERVLRSWIAAASSSPYEGLQDHMLAIVRDTNREGATRVAAFRWFEQDAPDELSTVLQVALDGRDSELRAAGLGALSKVDLVKALPLFKAVLKTGGIRERRAVYRALSKAASREAEELLLGEFRKMTLRTLPLELQLDLVEAMYQRDSNVTRLQIDQLRKARRNVDPLLAKWRDSLVGGDREAGRKIFEEDAALACTRCHLFGDQADTGVGPNLTGIGSRLTRDQLIQSVIQPNERIAPGFEFTLLVLDDDSLVAGRIISETADLVQVLQSSTEIMDVDPATIVERRPDLSPMPEGLNEFMTARAMRDLVEYLCSL